MKISVAQLITKHNRSDHAAFRVGAEVTPRHPSQTRTCPIKASGSSLYRFTYTPASVNEAKGNFCWRGAATPSRRGYSLRFREHEYRFQGTCVFAQERFCTTVPRFPRLGPLEAAFPSVISTIIGALRLPAPNTELLMDSLLRSTLRPLVYSRAAETHRTGMARLLSPRASGRSRVVAHRISQVPGESFPYLCPALRPRPARCGLTLAATRYSPQLTDAEDTSINSYFVAQSRGFSTRCLRFK